MAYALVTPCGQPFGDLLQFRVEKKVETPVCVTLQAPDSCLEGLQGEVKTLHWTLANVSKVKWPADTCCRLFYNTPGFAKLPTDIDLPTEVPPGLTVDMEVQVLLPEQEGTFKAMWAVTSPSTPDFGEASGCQIAWNIKRLQRRQSKVDKHESHGRTNDLQVLVAEVGPVTSI